MRILCRSYRHWTGRELINLACEGAEAVELLDAAPFAVVSHDTGTDPVFNYGNRMALQLFEMPQQEFTALPSRMSAEPMVQAERDHLLNRVAKHGYIDDYSGVRIARSGRRFRITNATVWNLLDENGVFYGQAALIPEYQLLPE